MQLAATSFLWGLVTDQISPYRATRHSCIAYQVLCICVDVGWDECLVSYGDGGAVESAVVFGQNWLHLLRQCRGDGSTCGELPSLAVCQSAQISKSR